MPCEQISPTMQGVSHGIMPAPLLGPTLSDVSPPPEFVPAPPAPPAPLAAAATAGSDAPQPEPSTVASAPSSATRPTRAALLRVVWPMIFRCYRTAVAA